MIANYMYLEMHWACLIPACETIPDLCENCDTVMDQVKLR